ncbi:MAG: prepilin-type N-terminal cleavage/methylation domain-containing protein [Candidatus Rokubacteria bacterium]|nr:prepilin-type N-terminal cleavage/methylation domain-containing protein [Candidatus Rokubacteria bacterium]
MRRMLRDQRGFTLTELLVVTAVLAIVLGAVILIQQKGQEAYIMGSNRVETQQNARVALDLMTRELRSATAVTAIPSGTNMTFTDQNGTTVQYQLGSGNLTRTTGGVATILIGGVQSLAFTYYSAYNGQTNTGTTTGTASAVKVIKLTLETGTEEAAGTGSFANQFAKMESMVRLRNL